MSRIQSSTGLITGIPIEDTVNKLMAIATQPRNILDSRTKSLQSEQLAVNKLSSLVLAFQFEANRLGNASLFEAKSVNSSDSDACGGGYREQDVGECDYSPVPGILFPLLSYFLRCVPQSVQRDVSVLADVFEAHGNTLRDARLFHRDAVQRVGASHRPLGVRDDNKLGKG